MNKNLNAILLVNKECGYTSRDVINILNKKFKTKKIGHTGTLDPIASGVLVVCIGKYTKLVSKITAYEKTYIAEIKLGIKTDTGDITGKVLKTKEFNVTKDKLKKTLKSFLGKQIQTVPKYSAVKVNGKKLYEYARNNEYVELPQREIEIKDIKLLEFNNDIIKFETTVSKGTYIRSLIEDICEKLNTVGTMKSLIRTKQGNFKIEDSFNLKEIENDKYKFIDIEKDLGYKVIEIDDDLSKKVLNGCKIELNSNESKVILKNKNEIIALYERDNMIYKPLVMLKTNE